MDQISKEKQRTMTDIRNKYPMERDGDPHSETNKTITYKECVGITIRQKSRVREGVGTRVSRHYRVCDQ